MIIFLGLLKEDLEADEAGLPAEFINIPENILAQLAKEAGEDRGKQIETIDKILESLERISYTNSHNAATSQDEGANEEASKTQGTLPGAHTASPTEEWQDGTRRERNLRAWRTLDNRRRPSMGAAADGGGTSSTAANSTTSASRQRGAAKQATTCREDLTLLRSTQQWGQPLGQSMYGSKGKLAKLNYMDINLLLDRQIVKNKRGSLSEKDIQTLVKDWHDRRSEGELRQETIEMETKSMEKKLRR